MTTDPAPTGAPSRTAPAFGGESGGALLRVVGLTSASLPLVWGWLLPAYLLFDPLAAATAGRRGIVAGLIVAAAALLLTRHRSRAGVGPASAFRAGIDLAALSAFGAIATWLLTQLDDRVPYVESFSQVMLQVATGWAAALVVFVFGRRALRHPTRTDASLPRLTLVFATATTAVGLFAAVWLGVGSSGRLAGAVDRQQADELHATGWMLGAALMSTTDPKRRAALLQPLTADPFLEAHLLPVGKQPRQMSGDTAAFGPGRAVALTQEARWHVVTVPLGDEVLWLVRAANIRPPVRSPDDAPSLLILAFLVLGAPLAAVFVAVDLRDGMRAITDGLLALGPNADQAPPRPLRVSSDDEIGDLTVALNTSFTRFVTENRHLAVDLEAAQAQDRARGRLLTAASHELRTPLTTIIGYCHLVDTGPLTPPQREDVTVIAAASEQLLGHVDEILDLSRIEAGHEAPLVYERIDLMALARDVAARNRDTERELELSVEGEGEVWIDGDPQRLRQVLENLVGNALKFTTEGSVIIRVGAFGDGAELQVVDTGPGIPPEELDSIFSEFHRVRGRDLVVGTGLGLSIAQRLVKQHGGQIRADSNLGDGCVFTVILPPRKADKRQG